MATESRSKRKCRVLVVGSARPRVAKVMSLLLPLHSSTSDDTSTITTTTDNAFDIEYIPCVATFDSYEGASGEMIRYLISVNYHGIDGSDKKGSTLAPFFDEEPARPNSDDDKANNSKKRPDNLGILGIAFGAGVEDEQDVERIRQLFQTLRGATLTTTTADDNDEPDPQQQQPIQPLATSTIQPNPDFSSMKEETDAFRLLSNEEKDVAADQGSIGPGKMARFIHTFATGLVGDILQQEDDEDERVIAHQCKQEKLEQQQKEQADKAKASSLPVDMDTTKPRYACRTCRTILFGEDDQEDPAHVPATHLFSYRKLHHGSTSNTSSSPCQSYFLTAQGLPWMGDTSATEGRISCPKCKTKVGTWNWHGAQCSCGTWVAPALQIPKSKLDVIPPISNNTSNDSSSS